MANVKVAEVALENHKPVYWAPQKDITTYELAVALGILIPATAGPRDWARLLESFDEDVRRHFTLDPS